MKLPLACHLGDTQYTYVYAVILLPSATSLLLTIDISLKVGFSHLVILIRQNLGNN